MNTTFLQVKNNAARRQQQEMAGVPWEWLGNNAVPGTTPTPAPRTSGNGIDWQSIINQSFALGSQFLGSRGRFQTQQVAGGGISIIPNYTQVAAAQQQQAIAQQQQQQYLLQQQQMMQQQQPNNNNNGSIDNGLNDLGNFVKRNLGLVALVGIGGVLLMMRPPVRRNN